MKHFKNLFTALLLLCTTMATAHDFEVGAIYYNIINATKKTVEVTCMGSYHYDYSNEYTGGVVIPESVTYNGTTYSVTSIGDYAFCNCTGLTSIVVPNSVTSIGRAAFYYCTGLTSIVIPNSVTSIGRDAFYDCTGLTSIEIPNCVTSIGNHAFSGCSGLTSITIPNSVTSIGDGAFGGCKRLTSIVIPNSVTSIGDYAFYYCTGLTGIEIPNSVTSIGDEAFFGCTGLTSVVIGNSVTSIGDYAFKNCFGLTSIVIPNSVTSIGDEAFFGCDGLTSVVIGNSVTSIGDYAFKNCFGLTSIVIGNCVTSIGDWAFYGCDGLTSIVIPNSVTSIGDEAFFGCDGLTSVVIGNSVTSIGDGAFGGCKRLTSVEIPNSVTSIGDYAFSGCTGLTSIVVAEGNAKYDSRENCNAIIETCTNALVVGCKNTIIPNSVTSIGEDAFYGCSGLTSVEIGNSVTSIGEDAFYGCSGLTSVEIGNSVTSIGEYAFFGCSGLTSIVIPNSVTSIGDYAFCNCTGLTSVVIGNGVTSIGNYAFYGCGNLKTVINCSPSLTITKGSTDYGCVAYYAENIVNGSIIDDFLFYVIDGVNTLVQYLGNDAKIVLPENYKGGSYVIGAEAFYNNTSITSVEIPNSVTSIGTYAFYNCNNVESLYIGNSIQQIGDYAFEGCNNLFDIKVANKKVITISDNVFSVDSYNNAVLYVPTGRSTVYKNRTPWNKFIVIEEIDFDKIEITGISLYKETLALIEGETETLTATIKPSYATDQTVTWTSDNEEVATVDGGVVTAVKAGTATITATAGGYSESCVVTVEAAVHPITSLAELSNTAVYYICQPNHSSGETSWAVATNGNALKSNKDLNIATDMNDTRQQFAILSIDGGATRYLYHVATKKFVNKDGSLSTTPADAISFMNGAYDNTFFAYFDGSHNVNVDGYQQMIIDGWNTPDGGNSCSIIPVGEFDSTGELNKLLDITVTKITLNEIDITLTEGENFTLTATLTPDDVSDAFVIWTTSNSHIATVERGVVTAIKPGRAAITATAGDYSASCVVTVEAAVYPITSLAELSNSGVYYICQANHSKGATSWAVATNGNALKSNKDLNIATDMNDTRQQFAILSIDGGATRYLYHVATQKFVNKDGSLSTTPADAISFMNGAYDNTFFAYFDGSHNVNVGGNKQMIIDDWNTPDGGNSCSITPVGEFDSAAALKAINDLATGIEDVKGENGEVKAVYDLQGRKVENPTTGIYIIDGKKVLVK